MNANKLLIPVLTLLSAFLLVSFARGQKNWPQPEKEFMREKLHHAQKVLEGLTTGDFKMVTDHAERLKAMASEPGWKHPGEEYASHTASFTRRVNSLITAAKDQDAEGATLAYVAITINCMECHKHVRSKQIALSEMLLEDDDP